MKKEKCIHSVCEENGTCKQCGDNAFIDKDIPTTNKRVYVIKVADDKGSDDYTDEEFMTLAEEQGTVYSLKGFQDAFNYEEIIDFNHYIRIR